MDYVTHVVAIGAVTLLANSFLKIYCEPDTGLTMCAGAGVEPAGSFRSRGFSRRLWDIRDFLADRMRSTACSDSWPKVIAFLDEALG